MFKPVSSQVDFPKLEENIQAFWRKNNTSEKYLHRNDSSSKRFSFLDGPITANNPMGVHHAWGRTLKDLYQRFWSMRGYKERFQNGFDNQGLWVEVEVEKKLGFKSKKDIETYGIAKFVEACKAHTQEYAKIQTEQSKRLGYFMNWDNSYFTMSDENNYAIWHFLKTCHEKNYLYKGRDSVPWCPRCGTAISQHEILNEEYVAVTHDSVYFCLPVDDETYLLVWTTTPWTILGNTLVAYNPEMAYVLAEFEGKKYYLAKSKLGVVLGQDASVVKELTGRELAIEVEKYQAPFDELPSVSQISSFPHFHTLIGGGEFVNEEEGTGLVHIAPGCGSEDFHLAKDAGYDELILPVVDEGGNYLEGFGEFAGQNAKQHPEIILDYLKTKDNGKYLFKVESYTHRYPVCWRCKTELIWRVVDEWYIKMDELRLKMMTVAKKINWIPDFGLDLELDWLKNMHDWLISKKRYWGLALPIWECPQGHFTVIGSKEELKEKAVEGWEDFEGHSPHRPWIDAVKIKCPECNDPASRISDVGNPWLDAGIVPFSTMGYFSEKSYWEDWFPADLVLESFPGQFKNWFYSMIAMATVLEDANPFKNLLGHALVRDEKGEEMHKSKGNAIWFDDAVAKIGADPMRWLYARQNPTLNLNFGYGPIDEVRRRFLLILWNSYKFFVDYANVSKWQQSEATNEESKVDLNVLDAWILSKLNNLLEFVTKHIEDLDHSATVRELENFVVNDLSSWYIRRSRDRMSPANKNLNDKNAAFATLYHVLLTLTKILAIYTPHLAEDIYQNLIQRGDGSVHLTDWPEVNSGFINSDLENQMGIVRQIVEKGHAARKEAGIKVRQPLSKITVTGDSNLSNQLIDLIKSELNIKSVEFTTGSELAVTLDITITPELKAEGEAREIIRQIQDLRKSAGCDLSAFIQVEAPDWPEEFTDFIKKQTLSLELRRGPELKIVS